MNRKELLIHSDELVEVSTPHNIQHATCDNTRKTYQADIRHFMAWGGLLPTTPDPTSHPYICAIPYGNDRICPDQALLK